MSTHCTSQSFDLQASGRRTLTAKFDGGPITSDAGALLLRGVDEEIGLSDRFAACFLDSRDPNRIEHSIPELLRQRIYGLALAHEDLNDHEQLRCDPLLAEAVGKKEPTGCDRARERDRGRPLAGKSTLNRLEWCLDSESESERYHRILLDPEAMETFFVDLFIDGFESPPEEIVLDFDATDNPLHGRQEGRFFHGYYDCYCYLPLYVFCRDQLLWAQLRTSDRDASDGAVDVLETLSERIREHWPEVRIILRADSGFARDALMDWCETHDVEFVVGMARNDRLERMLEPALEKAEQLHESGEPKSRVFADLTYRTLDSWSRERRVVGKAEVTSFGRNPRFIVTNVDSSDWDAQELYETFYCGRGDAENRIKEQQLDLFSTRTSGHKMKVNQVRLWLSAAAYSLMEALRRLGLRGTRFERSQCGKLRTELLKIGAVVKVTARRIWVSMSSAFPHQDIFALLMRRFSKRALRAPA